MARQKRLPGVGAHPIGQLLKQVLDASHVEKRTFVKALNPYEPANAYRYFRGGIGMSKDSIARTFYLIAYGITHGDKVNKVRTGREWAQFFEERGI